MVHFYKKYWVFLGVGIVLVLLGASYAELLQAVISNAQQRVVKLTDQRVFAQACSMTCTNCSASVPACSALDNDSRANVLKEKEIEVAVPSTGGYLALYFDDLKDYGSQYRGGFSFHDAHFVSHNGDEYPLNDGLRVWTGGKVLLKFDQPYSDDGRAVMDYRFILYFLANSSVERAAYLNESSKGRDEGLEFIQKELHNVKLLCDRIGNVSTIPAGCAGGKSSDAVRVIPQGGTVVVKPGSRPVDFELEEVDRFVFVDQPVTLKVVRAEDPDGLCAQFLFEWKNLSPLLRVASWEADQDDWSLFFIPRSAGTYTIQVRITEQCGEQGNTVSDWQTMRVHSSNRQTSFPDLDDAPGYQGYIMDLYLAGVMTGYGDGMMRPKNRVNRAEFLKMLFETVDLAVPRTAYSARYTDVKEGEWFSKYVFMADELGVIQGYPDGLFRPGANVNRVEALKMAMQFTDLEVRDSLEVAFGDVYATDWFSRYVQTAYREGILDELEVGQNVFPGEFITRAEAAKIIVRTFLRPVNRLNQVNLQKVR